MYKDPSLDPVLGLPHSGAASICSRAAKHVCLGWVILLVTSDCERDEFCINWTATWALCNWLRQVFIVAGINIECLGVTFGIFGVGSRTRNLMMCQ